MVVPSTSSALLVTLKYLTELDIVVQRVNLYNFICCNIPSQETWDKSYPEPDLRLIIIENTKQEEGWQGKLPKKMSFPLNIQIFI